MGPNFARDVCAQRGLRHRDTQPRLDGATAPRDYDFQCYLGVGIAATRAAARAGNGCKLSNLAMCSASAIGGDVRARVREVCVERTVRCACVAGRAGGRTRPRPGRAAAHARHGRMHCVPSRVRGARPIRQRWAALDDGTCTIPVLAPPRGLRRGQSRGDDAGWARELRAGAGSARARLAGLEAADSRPATARPLLECAGAPCLGPVPGCSWRRCTPRTRLTRERCSAGIAWAGRATACGE